MKPALFSALFSITLFLLWSGTSLAADVHKEVQAALDYQVPYNNCKKPKGFTRTKSTSSSPPLAAGSINLSGGGDADVSDTDSNTKKRLKRKEKKWLKCVSKYKSGLLNDSARLEASAQYGISQVQANTILGNMRRVQDVYMWKSVV